MTKRKNVFRLFAVLCALFSLTLVACDEGENKPKDNNNNEDIELSLGAVETSLEVGEVLQLSWTVEPSDATVTFQSSDTEVASVGAISGKVTALADGVTTITAKATKSGYNEATDFINITVGETASSVEEITFTLNASETMIEEGESTQLTWDVSPTDASVTFESSSASVATVNSSGKVTAVKAGSTTITATASKSGYTSVSDSVIITVTAKEEAVTIDSYYALYGDFSGSSWNVSPSTTSEYCLGYSSKDDSTKYWEVTVKTNTSQGSYDPSFRIVKRGGSTSGTSSDVVANYDNLSYATSTGVRNYNNNDNNIVLDSWEATYNLTIDMTGASAVVTVRAVIDYSNCDSKYLLVGDFIDADWATEPENEDYYLPYLSSDSSTKTWERIITVGAHPETDDWYTWGAWDAGFRIIDNAALPTWTTVADFSALDTNNSTGVESTGSTSDNNIQLTSWSATYKLVIDLTSTASITVTIATDEDGDSCYEGEALNLASDFAMGMDVSSIIEVENAGGVFYDESGTQVDAITYLASKGVNYARIRLWNDPTNANGDSYEGGGNNVTRDIEIAKRCVNAGMKICLDFHYSDFWAHHGQQYCPKAWTSLSASERITTAASWTKDVLQQFKDEGCEPSMVQVGNETNNNWICGFEGGSNAQNFFVQCTKAVREFDSNIQIVVHYADDQYASAYTSSWQSLINAGAEIDVLGLSYYPFWHESMSSFKTTLNTISEAFPNKKICLMEYSYAWTTAWKDVGSDNRMNNSFWTTEEAAGGYSASVYGQSKCIYDIHETLASVSNVIGSFYWEPGWLCVESGTSTTSWASSNSAGYYQDNGVSTSGYTFDKCTWANQAFFNYSGKAIDSINIYDMMLGNN